MRKLPFRKFFAAGSLALCIGATALWMRSTTEMDQLRSANSFRQTTLVSANGEVCVETVTALAPEFDPGMEVAHALSTQFGPRALNWQLGGLGAGKHTDVSLDGPIRYDTLMIPLWMIVVLLAIPPILVWDSRRGAIAPATPNPIDPIRAWR